MKSLFSYYLRECGSTPAATLGAGEPTIATDTSPGSEPIIPIVKKRKRRK